VTRAARHFGSARGGLTHGGVLTQDNIRRYLSLSANDTILFKKYAALLFSLASKDRQIPVGTHVYIIMKICIIDSYAPAPPREVALLLLY
jgi:hypothetical protein